MQKNNDLKILIIVIVQFFCTSCYQKTKSHCIDNHRSDFFKLYSNEPLNIDSVYLICNLFSNNSKSYIKSNFTKHSINYVNNCYTLDDNLFATCSLDFTIKGKGFELKIDSIKLDTLVMSNCKIIKMKSFNVNGLKINDSVYNYRF